MKKYPSIFIFIIFTLISCTKKNSEAIDPIHGLDYYPLTIGKYIIYEVDSTIYIELPPDTVEYKYLIKEKIADSYTDNTGKSAFRIERYIKKFNSKISYDSMPWIMKEVFMLNATNRNIQIVESNIRYTKLAFPVQTNASWNGNAANTLGEQNYKYQYIDNPEKINKTNFDNVLLVVQKEFHPKTLDYYYVEKYAKGLGLVYKEVTDVVSNKGNNYAIPVLQRIEYGVIYKQSFLSIGYE